MCQKLSAKKDDIFGKYLCNKLHENKAAKENQCVMCIFLQANGAISKAGNEYSSRKNFSSMQK